MRPSSSRGAVRVIRRAADGWSHDSDVIEFPPGNSYAPPQMHFNRPLPRHPYVQGSYPAYHSRVARYGPAAEYDPPLPPARRETRAPVAAAADAHPDSLREPSASCAPPPSVAAEHSVAAGPSTAAAPAPPSSAATSKPPMLRAESAPPHHKGSLDRANLHLDVLGIPASDPKPAPKAAPELIPKAAPEPVPKAFSSVPKATAAHDMERKCIALAWEATQSRCEAIFESWYGQKHLVGWADAARRVLHTVHDMQQASGAPPSIAAAIAEADGVRAQIESWPTAVAHLDGALDIDSLEGAKLNAIPLRARNRAVLLADQRSRQLRQRRASAEAVVGLRHVSSAELDASPSLATLGLADNPLGLVERMALEFAAVQVAILLNRELTTVLLCGVDMDASAGSALWAALAARPAAPQRLCVVIGFNGMAAPTARLWAVRLHELLEQKGEGASPPAFELQDASGTSLRQAADIEDALAASKDAWVDDRLFTALLQSSVDSTLGAPITPVRLDSKFGIDPVDMVFDDETTFKDGIYGLYKRRGLDPDRLLRSIEQEFRQNERGRWLLEFQYVVEQPAKSAYPSTKGKAPTDEERPAYTRDLGHDDFALEDFYNRQPGLGTKNELTRAEVVVLRLYTGPVFKPWNEWLRFGHDLEGKRDLGQGEGEGDVVIGSRRADSLERAGSYSAKLHTADDWSTSLAVLYNAIIKLSALAYPGVVYRGVKERQVKLPDGFVPHPDETDDLDHEHGGGGAAPPTAAGTAAGTASGTAEVSRRPRFAGGVEKAFMSTSRDSITALRYSGSHDEPGSILQIRFDMGSRGADVRWVSQFPAEQELLYPPCTSLTCRSVCQFGKKRVLQVTASVSTHRPDVSWCQSAYDKPPENQPKRPENLGPFALTALDVDLYNVELVDEERRRLSVRSNWAKVAQRERQRRTAWAVEGMRFSPVEAVSLGPREREGALIPMNATHYAFAYPLDDEDQLMQIEEIIEPTLRALTTVGGFAYFHQDGNSLELLSVNVLGKSDGRGLAFSGPLSFDNDRVKGEHVKRPPREDRHSVTLPQLMKCGIQKFCWMPAVGEHGAFGYFYANAAMDCFFPVTGVQSEDDARFFSVHASPIRKMRRSVTRLKLAQGLPVELMKRRRIKIPTDALGNVGSGSIGLDIVRPRIMGGKSSTEPPLDGLAEDPEEA